MWGVFPLYFPLLLPSGPVEILAHRMVWSALTMVLVVVVWRRWRHLAGAARSSRTRLFLGLAAVLITVNWGTYVYGVNSGQVVETSLGYFINPLVSVMLGVLVLGERLRPVQWVAVGLATAAVLLLTVSLGRPPWVALVLAFSFGFYGLAKKQAGTGAVESLTWETLLIAPLAIGFLVVTGLRGDSTFGATGWPHAVLMVGLGVVTAVPLLCFGAAATRVTLTTIGLLQYVGPTLQFLIGVLVRQEHMPAERWVGFVFVWLALAIFTVEALLHRRRVLRDAAVAAAC